MGKFCFCFCVLCVVVLHFGYVLSHKNKRIWQVLTYNITGRKSTMHSDQNKHVKHDPTTMEQRAEPIPSTNGTNNQVTIV